MNRKPHVASPTVTRPMTSRDSKRSRSWPQYIWSFTTYPQRWVWAVISVDVSLGATTTQYQVTVTASPCHYLSIMRHTVYCNLPYNSVGLQRYVVIMT